MRSPLLWSLALALPLVPSVAPTPIELERARVAHLDRFWPVDDGGIPQLGDARFSDGRAHLATLDLSLVALGRGDAAIGLDGAAHARIAGPEVRFERAAGVVEWWRSLPSGLEQGVDVAARPKGVGPLHLVMETSLSASVEEPGEVALRDGDGVLVARYAELVVRDADGARVPAMLSAEGTRIDIAVMDDEARYPLVVDPLVIVTLEAELPATGVSAGGSFGSTVRLDGTGTRALVAAENDSSRLTAAGSVHVFLRTGSTWARETTLFDPAGTTYDYFGESVAISDDGGTALVGVYAADAAAPESGAAHVYARTGTTWARTAVLVHAGAAPGDRAGESVALSADGTVAVVGVNLQTPTGTARVFVLSGGTWTEEATLVSPGSATSDAFPSSLAISAAGDCIAAGEHDHDSGAIPDTGRVHLFRRTGTTWTVEATLVGSGAIASRRLGRSVALDAGCSTLLAGAPGARVGSITGGAAFRFTRTGTTWTEDGLLTPSPSTSGAAFGIAVDLSGDGARALVGAVAGSGATTGETRLFARSGTTWRETAILPAPDAGSGDSIGSAVALSRDGAHALAGGYGRDTTLGSDVGTAYAYALVAGAANGVACTSSASCASDQCIDGVCCENACGDGAPGDCQACAAALTGAADGTCAPLAAGSICRIDVGACDVAETCDGTSTACPRPDVAPSGTLCRPTAGDCDAAERCDGTSTACPGDARSAPGVLCRGAADLCDVEETCDGASAVCPADVVRAAGTPCRDAMGLCDVADTCDGASPVCANDFAPAGMVCNTAVADVCDAPDVCSGDAPACPATYLVGTACRDSAGACDVAETCSGDAAECPSDEVAAAGVGCRDSTSPTCDPAEVCDGTASSCPADVNDCSTTDAGPRDGGVPTSDGGGTSDGGTPVAAAAGCGCRVGHGSPRAGLLVLAAIALVGRRRQSGARTRARSARASRSSSAPTATSWS